MKKKIKEQPGIDDLKRFELPENQQDAVLGGAAPKSMATNDKVTAKTGQPASIGSRSGKK